MPAQGGPLCRRVIRIAGEELEAVRDFAAAAVRYKRPIEAQCVRVFAAVPSHWAFFGAQPAQDFTELFLPRDVVGPL